MIINTLYTSLLFLLVTSISFAKEINITSNELMIDRENKISTFYGDVYVFEDDMEIWADQLTIKFNDYENEVEEIHAKNNVKIVRENIVATGKTGFYYPGINEIKMLEGVEVKENNNLIKCDELFLDIENSTSIMRSNSENRVEAIIINND